MISAEGEGNWTRAPVCPFHFVTFSSSGSCYYHQAWLPRVTAYLCLSLP